MSNATAIRIDSLAPGSTVTIDYNGKYEEKAIFVKIEGEGDTRTATFLSRHGGVEGALYEWEAYRFSGRWAFGTSAERMSIVSVDCAL